MGAGEQAGVGGPLFPTDCLSLTRAVCLSPLSAIHFASLSPLLTSPCLSLPLLVLRCPLLGQQIAQVVLVVLAAVAGDGSDALFFLLALGAGVLATLAAGVADTVAMLRKG